MDSSILLARFIGPFIIVIGLAVVCNTMNFQKIAEDFFKNSALIYVGGLITFVAGLAVVLFHNIWTPDWRMIITLFGWLTLIKGAWLIILPGTLPGATKVFLRNVKMLTIPWAIMLALGIFLSVKGFK